MTTKKSMTSLGLMIVIGGLLNGCESNESLQAGLAGSWEGFNQADGISWCFEFKEDDALVLSTLQKVGSDNWEGDWQSRGRLVQYVGSWEVAAGKRIMMFASPENVFTENRSELAQKLVHPTMANVLVVTDLEENEFTAVRDDSDHKDFAITSGRVDRCPAHYQLSALSAAAANLETDVQGEE